MRAVLFILACLALAGCSTVRTHPEFRQRHPSIQAVSVMPPDAQAFRITFNSGDQFMAGVARMMEETITGELAGTLRRKGYEVRDLRLDEQNLEAQPFLKEALFEMQSLYRKALEDIAGNRQKHFTYSVGPVANIFADRSNVDALVLTRAVAHKKSGGQLAADVVNSVFTGLTTLGMHVPPVKSSDLVIETAVVDSDLGDILWYHLQQSENQNPSDAKRVASLVKKVISPFPKRA